MENAKSGRRWLGLRSALGRDLVGGNGQKRSVRTEKRGATSRNGKEERKKRKEKNIIKIFRFSVSAT